MSSILWKNFFLCFSNFKCTTTLLPTSTSKQDSSSISLSSTTSTLINNFKSIYHHSTTSKSLSSSTDGYDLPDNNDSTPPDFTTIFASQRFFCSSPGHSNSIIHSQESSSSPESTTPITGGIPVQTYSPDPYLDFLRSMEEMVGARNLTDVADDWDFLHELLLCYLTLNPKDSHKFILGAFSDLLVSLLSPTSRRKIDHRQHHVTPQPSS